MKFYIIESCHSDFHLSAFISESEATALLDDSPDIKKLQPKKLFEKNAGKAAARADTPKYLLQQRQSERLNSELEEAEDKENLKNL